MHGRPKRYAAYTQPPCTSPDSNPLSPAGQNQSRHHPFPFHIIPNRFPSFPRPRTPFPRPRDLSTPSPLLYPPLGPPYLYNHFTNLHQTSYHHLLQYNECFYRSGRVYTPPFSYENFYKLMPPLSPPTPPTKPSRSCSLPVLFSLVAMHPLVPLVPLRRI